MAVTSHNYTARFLQNTEYSYGIRWPKALIPQYVLNAQANNW